MNEVPELPEPNDQASLPGWFQFVRLGVFLLALAFLVYLLMIDYGPEASLVDKLMLSIREGSFVLPLIISVFAILGLVGVPQFVLISACIIAFGPIIGGLYSWIATSISACLQFWIARFIGAGPITRFGGELLNRVSKFIGKNGLLSSMVVRVIPTGPFVLVNLALGISKVRFRHFLIGTLIGIIPKILMLSFVAQGVTTIIQGEHFGRAMLYFSLGGLSIIGIWVFIRVWRVRQRAKVIKS